MPLPLISNTRKRVAAKLFQASGVPRAHNPYTLGNKSECRTSKGHSSGVIHKEVLCNPCLDAEMEEMNVRIIAKVVV